MRGRIGLARAAAGEPEAARSLDEALELARAVGEKNEYELLVRLAGYEKDKPPPSAFCGTLPAWRPPRWRGETSLGLPPKAAARTAALCGAAVQDMARNLNQKLLLTCLAARMAG